MYEDGPRVEWVNLTVQRQGNSLVAWLTQSPGVPGSSPVAAYIFTWCTNNFSVTQTVQIRGTNEKYDRFAQLKKY